jgi:hypothetical protein
MKYLDLNNTEMKELLQMRREHFVIYIITLFIISGSTYIILHSLIKSFICVLFAAFLAFVYTCYVIYINRKYLKEIIYKKKKVYHGAVSFKTVYQNGQKIKYLFNVDGRIFYVDKRKYESIEEGDIVEFHVSSSTKHLFKVEKIK